MANKTPPVFLLKIFNRNVSLFNAMALFCLVEITLLLSSLLFAYTPVKLLIFVTTPLLPLLVIPPILASVEIQQKKMEKQALLCRRARKRVDYLESILHDSTDIIFTLDVDGFILKFNKGAELHFGYTQTEIVGKPFEQLFVNHCDERKILDEVLLQGKSVNAEIPMKTHEGEIILLNLSMSEMKNESNEIIGLVVTAKDITEKKKLEMELRKKNELLSKLAITDSLTELYNLRRFYEQINHELHRLYRYPDRRLSLILMDIDNFKELNDTEGHQAGDQVLKTLAQIIRLCLRKDVDSGYRYGGDEFIIILPDTDKSQASIAAQRIQRKFDEYGKTTLSIGIAEAKPGEDEKSLIKRADRAMYMSKRNGRKQITFQ
ncbi:MAG: diguanylate cyclase domain-containing protein [Chitinispirillaceae bacterium]